MKLRPYQQKCIDDVRNEFAHKNRHVVCVAPCGAGKTVIAAEIVKRAVSKGNRVIFFVHREELIAQTAKTFLEFGIEFGVISANHEISPNIPVQIASVQTLARRLNKLPTPNLLICDEAHHILAKTYRKVIDAWPNAFLLGLTATPQRMGGVTLGDVFDSMVETLTPKQLIDSGCLTRFEYYAPEVGVDLSHVKKHFGEFDNDDLEHVMSDKKIIGGIVNNYLKYADGKQAICYCVNVNHSKTVADAFSQAGISAAHVDGDTPKNIRAEIVEDFRAGRIKILCNAELFGEGFDVPNCQAVILARPTNSLTLHVQQSMRALRRDPNDPNKVAVIIDHVQNYLRHGLPDQYHDWKLHPEVIAVWQRCSHCKKNVLPEVNKRGEFFCPKCGAIFPPHVKKPTDEEQKQPVVRDVFEYDGELQLIETKLDDAKQTSTVKHVTKDLDELLLVFERQQKERGFKRAYIAYLAKPFAQSYDDCLYIARFTGVKDGWAYFAWQERKQELTTKKKR